MADLEAQLLAKQNELIAQWDKYDSALKSGMTGAPLVQIDKKLGRLERGLEDLWDLRNS